MKKIGVVFCILVLIVGIAAGAVLRGKYVYIDDTFYKKDVKELFIHWDHKHVSELNRCTELEMLMATGMDNDSLEQMCVFENLTDLLIHFSHAEISGSGIEKINLLPNLKYLWFRDSEIDLSNISNDSIESIEITGCEMTDSDLKGLKNCPSLTKLSLSKVAMDNCFIIQEKKYTMTDSSCFSELDNMKELEIYLTFIEDISGIEDMDSLETLTVDKGYISDAYKTALEDKGITVIEYVRE